MGDIATTGSPEGGGQQPSPPGTGEERLSVSGVSKRYGAVRAIRNADLTVRAGSVHALVGENGAGKSTLIKILSGAATADTGSITFDGRPVTVHSTADAMPLALPTLHHG